MEIIKEPNKLAKEIAAEMYKIEEQKQRQISLALSLIPGVRRLLRKERGFFNFYFKTKHQEIIDICVNEAIRRTEDKQ